MATCGDEPKSDNTRMFRLGPSALLARNAVTAADSGTVNVIGAATV